MTDTTTHAHRPASGERRIHAALAGAQPTTRGRLAGALLLAAATIFFLAEFIAAAAWTDPPYSYTHHYISNLGVRGPLEALGQDMNSPLAWVMNTGFFLFGALVLAGVAALGGPPGRRRPAALVLGALVAVGGVLLAFNPGSGEPPDGAVDPHGLGAFACIVAGNLLVILLGHQHRPIGLAPALGARMVLLGSFGLVSLVAFLAVTGAGASALIGLVERCAVYPVLVGLVCAGASLRTARA